MTISTSSPNWTTTGPPARRSSVRPFTAHLAPRRPGTGERYQAAAEGLAARRIFGVHCLIRPVEARIAASRVKPNNRHLRDRTQSGVADVRVASLDVICETLNAAGVQYLIAGGIAVNAHGYVRLTNGVDLVVRLEPVNVANAFRALEAVGYRPMVPVRAEDFADPVVREGWIRDKGMQVLRFWSDRHRETAVDVFVTEPFDFAAEYATALAGELSPGLVVRFVGLESPIRMKEAAGRPRDLDDVQHLRWILEDHAK
jgi:hypothetical protein